MNNLVSLVDQSQQLHSAAVNSRYYRASGCCFTRVISSKATILRAADGSVTDIPRGMSSLAHYSLPSTRHPSDIQRFEVPHTHPLWCLLGLRLSSAVSYF